MCGIAGIIEYATTNSGISPELLRAMSDVIAHRGPDDQGQWISPTCRRCGFTFRRLAIIDLSPAGHQPMTTPDGRYTIVFNGEIYNHMDIRRQLEQRGYQYHSQSDTETILYGYREFGPAILDKMVGMWGLAIWDDQEKELFFARDRIGIKPFYFTMQGGRFIFGSEIKSILCHPDILPRMNPVEMANYLAFSMTSDQDSMFDGIRKLPAGHCGVLRRDGSVDIRRYWTPLPAATPYSDLNEQQTINEIMRLLRQAVKDRMMSDVPFGVFLSGGIDSSTNVALMAELMDRPVDTFSVGFRELEKYNEMEYARQIAQQFNTNHHEILIDDRDALPVLEKLVWHEDEPNGDPVCIPLYFLSKLTREAGTTVIQVGEGSDEQFIGYPWMVRDLRFYDTWWKRFLSYPTAVQKALYAAVKPFMMAAKQYLALDYMRRAVDAQPLYWGGAVDYTPTHLRLALGPAWRRYAETVKDMPLRFDAEIQAAQANPADYAQRIAAIELKHRLPELLLMRVDKITMAHSLEARVPFLDYRLVEFTMTIPPALKMKAMQETKYLLKKAVEPILPHSIIYRRKQGFAAPVAEWLRGPWYSWAEHTLLNSRLVKDGVLNSAYLRVMLADHRNQRGKYGKALYSALNLALWHKVYMD
jgi:asparagine synthase (glutamine-hydrolysing)